MQAIKILLISDTHGKTGLLEKTILPKYADTVDMAIHLGDFAEDMLHLQPKFPDLKMIAVPGAFEAGGYDVKTIIQIVEIAPGVPVMLTHGHTLHVKNNLTTIAMAAAERNVRACFFGHSHVPVIFESENNSIFFMNPGSLTEPRTMPYASYGLITYDKGKFEGSLIKI